MSFFVSGKDRRFRSQSTNPPSFFRSCCGPAAVRRGRPTLRVGGASG